jgi:hypothetical protein
LPWLHDGMNNVIECDDTLEGVRQELDHLAACRNLGMLTAPEASRYRYLCGLEEALMVEFEVSEL